MTRSLSTLAMNNLWTVMLWCIHDMKIVEKKIFLMYNSQSSGATCCKVDWIFLSSNSCLKRSGILFTWKNVFFRLFILSIFSFLMTGFCHWKYIKTLDERLSTSSLHFSVEIFYLWTLLFNFCHSTRLLDFRKMKCSVWTQLAYI